MITEIRKSKKQLTNTGVTIQTRVENNPYLIILELRELEVIHLDGPYFVGTRSGFLICTFDYKSIKVYYDKKKIQNPSRRILLLGAFYYM
jgi:hypothetical protein